MFNQAFSESKYDYKDHCRDSVTNRVVVNGQLAWLVQKGDLLLSDAQKEIEKEVAFNFRETDNRMFKLPIYEYPDNIIPDPFGTAQEGIVEILRESK